MKKRKNIIISAITCMMSICLMMFGVYAASNPSVSISGQVSYSARDAKVLVLGKVNGQAGDDSNVDYPTVTDATNPQEDEKKVSASQYMGFTNGTGVGDDTDDLAPWTMNATHAFYEDSTGIRPIVISFKMTNLSNYPVVATVDFTGVTDANLASKNLTRETTGLKDSKVYLDKNVTKEISVTYSVANDAIGVNGDGLLNMSITFEKTVFPTPSNVKSQQGETMQSDWEYEFDGEAFAITGYKKAYADDCPATIVIPGSFACNDGKLYNVTMIGVNKDFDNLGDFLDSGIKPIFAPNALDEDKFNEKIQSIQISENIQIIGAGAFAACDNLNQINFSNTITKIGYGSIMYSGLESVSLPQISVVAKSAFEGCSNLTSVEFSNTVKIIDNDAFNGSGLVSLVIPNGVEKIGQHAFNACKSLTNIELPTTLKIIEDSAFSACTALTEIIIPKSVTEIGKSIFSSCTKLTNVELSQGIETIGYDMFGTCTSLTTIILPSSVKTINDYAFSRCDELTTITLNSLTPPSIEAETFLSCSKLSTIYVPSASVDAYKAADGWKNYADKIVGIV